LNGLLERFKPVVSSPMTRGTNHTGAGLLGKVSNLTRWLFNPNETYDLSQRLASTNTRYLASLIADITAMEFNQIMKHFNELGNDLDLKSHIADRVTRQLDFSIDWEARLGQRMGWYAFARALKPETVVEIRTGNGLGACLVTAALKRNAAEGFPGCYHGVDSVPGAGHLFSGTYTDYGEILHGSSATLIPTISNPIDLLIINSDFPHEQEEAMYTPVANRFSENAVLLSHHSPYSDALFNFSLQAGRRFILFSEKTEGPVSHGVGIGISYRKKTA